MVFLTVILFLFRAMVLFFHVNSYYISPCFQGVAKKIASLKMMFFHGFYAFFKMVDGIIFVYTIVKIDYGKSAML
jgi:hypothetical protein